MKRKPSKLKPSDLRSLTSSSDFAGLIFIHRLAAMMLMAIYSLKMVASKWNSFDISMGFENFFMPVHHWLFNFCINGDVELLA